MIDTIIKSEQIKGIECAVLSEEISYLKIDEDVIDNSVYIWEIFKVLKYAYDNGAFDKFDNGVIYDDKLTPTIYV